MSSAICFNLDQSKMLSSGNGLKVSERMYQLSLYQLQKKNQQKLNKGADTDQNARSAQPDYNA